jgi:hypothetical protein
MANVQSYNGNTLLRRGGISVGYTAEQISEWIKCRDDPVYFVEKYVKIVTLDKGVQPMNPYDFQKEIIEKSLTNSRTIVTCSRQNGKSTTFAALFCHYIIFNDDKTCAILANKAAGAREILSRVKFAYERLPTWLQHGIVEWNKGSIVLENGSRVLASATSGDAIRGYSVNFLALDEFAFLSTELADEFFTSVYPTLSSGKDSKLIMVSTPNGMNHFYKYWMEALNGINGFAHVFANWRAVPWRDDKWADDQRRVLGEQKFMQEFEGVFTGASNTLISGIKLATIPIAKPLMTNSTTSVYAKPESGRKYVMTVDTSRGTGGDYSAFLIIDITTVPYQVVFKYRNNTISSMLYPSVIYKIANEYNEATVYIETNDIGEGVANALYYDLEYENVIFSHAKDIVIWGGRNSLPGVRTTVKTKRVGCDTLKQLIEMDKLILNDAEILLELANFVVKGRSYEADSGNDDLAMCLVMFGHLVTSIKFEELTNDQVRLRIIAERQAQDEADALPIGYYSTGTEEEAFDDFKFT